MAVVQVALNPPRNVTTTDKGGVVYVKWDAPITGTPLKYNIYRDTKLVGDTTKLEYIDEDVSIGVFTYSVGAVYGTGESGRAYASPITMGDTNTDIVEESAKSYTIIDESTGSKISTYNLAPNEAVEYLKGLYFRETVDTDEGTSEEELTLSIDITPEYNDYSNAQNLSYLKNVWKFKGVADAILSIAYDFCEFSLNDSVNGMQITADDTGFKFESKYFVSKDSFVNYQTAIKLYTERFLTLKRQRYLWNYSKLRLNDLSPYTFNFFIFPEKG